MDSVSSFPGCNGETRRAFIAKSAKAGTLLAMLPWGAAIEPAKAACSFPYGSGLYGHGCYAGTLPKLLSLPAAQGNIQQQGFRFFLSGEPNRSYLIEYSSDLAGWTHLGNLVMSGDGSAVEIVDSEAAGAERRFYRATPL